MDSSERRADKYRLPARDLFDIIAAHDITRFLTLVRGVNPFDHSPGMELILAKGRERPQSANPFVIATDEVNVDPSTLGTACDTRGNTALHVAAGCGYLDMVLVLLTECAADVNSENLEGFTPLHCAARNGHAKCVSLLLEHGADARSVPRGATEHSSSAQDNGRTALYMAHFHGHYATALSLLPYYAEIVAKMPQGGQSFKDIKAALACMIRGESVAYFALLFDLMDCEKAGCGPILSIPSPPPLNTMRVCLCESKTLLKCLLPQLGTAMSQELLFIFRGLAARGFFTLEPTAPNPAMTMAIRHGHREAVSALLAAGVTLPADMASEVGEAFPATSQHPDGSVLQNGALHAIEVSELQKMYKDAMAAYRRKPESSNRKRAAWDAKVALRTKEMECTSEA